MNFKKRLKAARIIPIITIHESNDAVPLCEALLEGGLNVFEITMTTPCALEAIETVSQTFPECFVGAGTMLDAKQFFAAKTAGANFATSPATTYDINAAAEEQELSFVPGVSTPSEMLAAYEMGHALQRFSPTHLFGGIQALKTYATLFEQLIFYPVGDINLDSAAEYLALSNVGCVGGSWLTPPPLIEDKNFKAITKLARTARNL